MSNKITAIEKSFLILKKLAQKPYEFTVIEIGDDLNINRSTAHRIIMTLKDEMLIMQNPSNKKYSLGPTTYHIGMAYLNNKNNMEQIWDIINDIAKTTKLSIGYSIIEEGKIMNIYEIDDYENIKLGFRPGSFYSINCGAYGKTIMAFYEPREELVEIVHSQELQANTINTITDPEKLLVEYEKIRKNGYGISDEEGLLGAIGIGAPVFNYKGKIVGCIAASGIKSTFDKERTDEVIKLVVDGAKKISMLIP